MKLNMNNSFIDVNEDNHKVLFFHRRKCCTSIICKFCEDTACGDHRCGFKLYPGAWIVCSSFVMDYEDC